MDDDREERLWQRLQAIHDRVQRMANEAARSAWVRGHAAQGGLLAEKERLIEDAERILDQLEQLITSADET